MKAAAILAARLIFAIVFGMAAAFKFADMGATAGYIAAINFPAPELFAWLTALFELALVAAFLTGLFFQRGGAARCGLCPVPGLCLPWPVAMGRQPE